MDVIKASKILSLIFSLMFFDVKHFLFFLPQLFPFAIPWKPQKTHCLEVIGERNVAMNRQSAHKRPIAVGIAHWIKCTTRHHKVST